MLRTGREHPPVPRASSMSPTAHSDPSERSCPCRSRPYATARHALYWKTEVSTIFGSLRELARLHRSLLDLLHWNYLMAKVNRSKKLEIEIELIYRIYLIKKPI